MRIRKVRYRNFCQHVDTEAEFADGLTALMGPNGAGKTNMLNGLVWCLTGVDRNVGIKRDNVNLLAHPKDKAGVQAFLEHGGVELEVFRSLRDEGQYLKINGGRPITKDKDLRAELQQILGVSERVLLDYVFVQQRRVFDFLEADRDDVAKVFGQLFGTERAAELYKLLGEVRIPPPASHLDSDVVAARLEETRRQLQDVTAEIQAAAHLPEDWSEVAGPEVVLIRSYETKLTLQCDIASMRTKVAKLQDEMTQVTEAALSLCRERDTFSQFHQQRTAELVSVRRELAEWAPYSQALQSQQALTKELSRVEEQLGRSIIPAKPAGYIEADSEERRQLDAFHHEAVALKAFLKKWRETGRAACPECGTPTDQIVGRVPTAEERLAMLTPLIDDGVVRWRSSDAHRKAAAEVHKIHTALMTRKEVLEGQLASLTVPPQPPRTREVLQNFLTEQEGFDEHLRQLQHQYDEMRRLRGDRQSVVHALESQVREKEVAENAIDVDELRYQSARQRLARDRELVRRRDVARAQEVLLRRRLADDEDDLARCRAVHSKEERVEKLRTQMDVMREVFHRDNLVKDVVEGYLGSMRDRVNELLRSFDASFRVHDFVDWKFKVRKASGRIHSALRLSDGEKVLFALAFRVIVNAMFAKELGLLCLDEPTSGLDKDNMACLDVALGRLRELSRSRGLQVILVTHDRDVNLFDRVCRLAAPR